MSTRTSFSSQKKKILNDKLPESISIYILEFVPEIEKEKKSYTLSKRFTNLRITINNLNIGISTRKKCTLGTLITLFVTGSHFLGSLFTGHYLSLSFLFLNILIGYFILLFGILILSLLLMFIFGQKVFKRIMNLFLCFENE